MGEVLQAAGAALAARDVEALVPLYVEGFVFDDPAAGAHITTRVEPTGYFDALFSMPDVEFSDVDFFQCGDRAAGTWVWSGTSQNGEAFSVKGASVFEIAEGGIRRKRRFPIRGRRWIGDPGSARDAGPAASV